MEEQWTTPTTPHTAIDIPTGGLANNLRFLGQPLMTSGYLYSAWELNIPNNMSTVTNPAFVDVYKKTTLDNTNYVTGDSGVYMNGQQFMGQFYLYPLANSAQVLHIYDVEAGPFKFIPVIHNRTGGTLPATTTLKVSFYNRQVV